MEKLDKNNIEDILALTPMQEGMLFHYLKDTDSDAYFEQLSLNTSGEIDVNTFEKAWNFVIETNEMLRAVFRWEKVGNPIQVILKKYHIQPKYYDFSGTGPKELKKRLEEVKVKDRKEKFDLREVAFRVTLCKIQEDKHEIIISNHHILYDGWSNGILIKEFFKAYHDLSNGRELVRPVKTKFREFIQWHQNQDTHQQEIYWRDYLKGLDTQRRFSKKRIKTINPESYQFKLDADLTGRIKNFIKKHQITLASLFYSAWGILLQQYHSVNDILFDITVSGRSPKIKGIEEVVGLFINTLPMRVQTGLNEKISGFLSRHNDMLQRWQEFQFSPTARIKEYLDKSCEGNLFNSLLVIENYPLDKILKQDINTSILKPNGFFITETTYHDLSVIITTFDDMVIHLTYNLELFDKQMVKTLVNHFTLILRKLLEDPGKKVLTVTISAGEIRKCIMDKYAVSPPGQTVEYTAPRDPLEEELLDIWSGVFRVEKKEIGMDANFLDFGGHSLKAAVLRSMIHKRLNVSIPFGQLFKCLTIKEQAASIRQLKKSEYIPIKAVEKKEYYDVSHAQKRMWVLSQIEAASISLNIPISCGMVGKLEVDAVERAFQALLRRHESLRTIFITTAGEVKQKVLPPEEVGFKVQYIPMENIIEKEVKTRRRLVNESGTPFVLSDGPLLKVILFRLEKEKHVFFFNIHHIISDFISQEILFKEMLILHDTFVKGGQNSLKKLRVQYKDYTAWCKEIPNRGWLKEREYWLSRLKGKLPRLELPWDKKRPGMQTYNGDVVSDNIEGILFNRLKAFGEQQDVTLFMTCMAALNLLFYYYTGQSDIVLGTVTAGRDHADLQDQVGCYLNTLVLRTCFDPGDTFSGVLKKVKVVLTDAYQHQAYPFDLLVNDLGGHRDVSRHPFFDVLVDMFNYNDYQHEISNRAFSGDVRLSDLDFQTINTKFDLTIYLIEGKHTLNIRFEYNRDLFEGKTIERIVSRFNKLLNTALENPDSLISALKPGGKSRAPLIQAISRNSQLKASYHQERLWFIHQFETDNVYKLAPTYHNIPLILELGGLVDIDRLKQSLELVVNRHEALRTRMITAENQLFQRVEPKINIPFRLLDFTNRSDEKTYKIPLEMVIHESGCPFPSNLNDEPLIRAALIKFSASKSYLLLTLHHLTADRYSLGIIVSDFVRCYQSLQTGQSPQPANLYLHYADFSRWQRNLPLDFLEDRLLYWKRQLAGLSPLKLPVCNPRAPIHIFRAGSVSFKLSKELSSKIRGFCRQKNTRGYAFLVAAFKVLLYRYCGQEDIVIGTGADNRHQPGTEGIVGPMANLLVLRSNFSNKISFIDFFAYFRQTMEQAYENRDIPFDLLGLELNPQKDMSRTIFFDVLFQYEDRPFVIPPIDGLEVKYIETNLGWGKYDLNVLIRGGEASFTGNLVYNNDYYEASFISNFIRHYQVLLESILKKPDRPVSQLDILSPDERHRLLVKWNQTRAHYPEKKTIDQLFAEQVERVPDYIALIGTCAGAIRQSPLQLTYDRLQEKSRQLAYLLIKRGVKPDTMVGIMLERSLEMIIAILAILKAGGTYLPIDPDSPAERIRYMLTDGNVGLLVTTPGLQVKVKTGVEENSRQPHRLPLQSINIEPEPAPAFEPLSLTLTSTRKVSPTNLAYIIYTSGTTGRPKGCAITHRNLIRLFKTDRLPFHFSEHDTWIMAHNYCFDFSVWEMYGALVNGGRLVIPPLDGVRDVNRFLSMVKRHRITVLNQTPQAFNSLVEMEIKSLEKSLDRHLRYVIFGGDKLLPQKLLPWIERYSLEDIPLVNMYGITETTVHVTYYFLKEPDIRNSKGMSLIGKPLPETRLYILDTFLKPVPVWVAGEIFVGGTGVAPGYLNRLKLSPSRFFKNPHHPGEIIYKSGDLGRWLPDGNVEFLGRIDNQVKIRGFRIERGEIESQLLKHEAVKEAVVLANEREAGDKYLCAYLVSDTEIKDPEMRNFLSHYLPDYMIPSCFMQIERIPLTSNGKIDGKALPEPKIAAGEDHEEPRDEIEKQLLKIWIEVLVIDIESPHSSPPIGINSNFFHLGGHSLKAMALAAKIHNTFDVKLQLAQIFTTPTIKELAGFIRNALVKDRHSPIKAVEEKEYYQVSSAQNRMYIQQQLESENIAYNMPIIFQLEGEFDGDNLETTFRKLIQRHKSLRTSFEINRREPIQRIHKEVGFKIEYYRVEDKVTVEPERSSRFEGTGGLAPLPIGPAAALISSFVRPFDLSTAPLLRVWLIKIEKSKHLLAVDMPHIISDGISLDIFYGEFISLLHGEELTALPLSYKDYSEWHNRWLDSAECKKQEEYWLKRFDGEIPVLKMPSNYTRPGLRTYEGDSIALVIKGDLIDRLKRLVNDTGATLYMILLAVCNILLYRYTGQEDIIIGSVTSGRRYMELDRIIGIFVNMHAMRNFPTAGKTFREFLREVKKNTLDAFDNSDYPFEYLVSKLGIKREPGRHLLVDVVFQLQHFPVKTKQKLDESGISPLGPCVHLTKFDLYFELTEIEDTIETTIEYSTELFDRSTVEILGDNYIRILDRVLENSDIRLEEIEILRGLSAAAPDIMTDEQGDFGFQ